MKRRGLKDRRALGKRKGERAETQTSGGWGQGEGAERLKERGVGLPE